MTNKKHPNYENMTDKQKAGHDKWMKRSQNMETGGKVVMGLGCAIAIIGLFITFVVAIIFILF